MMRRLMPGAAAVALLAGLLAGPQAAAAPGTGAPTSAPLAAVTAAQPDGYHQASEFVLSRLPKGKKRVHLAISLMAEGKSRYEVRFAITSKGKVTARALRFDTKGRVKRLGRTKTIAKGIKAGQSYLVQAQALRSSASVRVEASMGPVAGRVVTAALATDRSRARISRPGSASIRWWAEGRPRPNVTLTPTASGPGPAVAAPNPFPTTQVPQTPFPPDQTTRMTGEPGTAAFRSDLQIPSASLDSRLPSSRDFSGLRTVYVSPSGNDSASGSAASPVRTIPRGVALAGPGGLVLLRGGTYPARANELVIGTDRSGVTITNHPGETPVIDARQAPTGPAASAGSGVVSFDYTAPAATLGEGASLTMLPAAFEGSTATAQASRVGWSCVDESGAKYLAPAPPASSSDSGCPAGHTARVITAYFPDQVWAGGRRLTQVLDRGLVRPGYFYVPRQPSTDGQATPTKVYLSSQDASSTPLLATSPSAHQIQVDAPDVTISGLRIVGYSGNWSRYALHIHRTAHNVRILDTEVIDAASIAVKVGGWGTPGGKDIVRNTSLDGVRILGAGWTGLRTDYVDGFSVTSSEISGSNPDDEWSPDGGGTVVAGGARLVKTHGAIFRGTSISGNLGQGLWVDQSSYEVALVANRIQDNSGHQVFFEFSHGLRLVGNLLVAGSSPLVVLRLSGASDTKLANNTFVGGSSSIWGYIDERSRYYWDAVHGQTRPCSEHRVRYGEPGNAAGDCAVYAASDFDMARPGAYGSVNRTPGLNWRTSITTLVDNVFAPAGVNGICGSQMPLCLTGYAQFGDFVNEIPMTEIIPRNAVVNGNVYQTDGQLILLWPGPEPRRGRVATSSLVDLQKGLSGDVYALQTPEWHGQAGPGWVDPDGSGTIRLEQAHAWAAPVPADSALNPWIPAGTRHYGAFVR